VTNDDENPSLKLDGKRAVLLLQGGGALGGAYRVGAYRALAQACRRRVNTKVGWVGEWNKTGLAWLIRAY
jgi:hypothetical protein